MQITCHVPPFDVFVKGTRGSRNQAAELVAGIELTIGLVVAIRVPSAFRDAHKVRPTALHRTQIAELVV